MTSNVLLHFGLETCGDLSLGCMLLLCKHDHFKNPRINAIIHSRVYQWTVLALFNILTSFITVNLIG